MSDQLTAAITRIVERVLQTRGVPRWGIVAAVDPARMRVRVRVQPEDVLSGWLPIAQLGAGAGATMLSVPVVGQMAHLSADNGEAEHAVVVGFSHSDSDPVPSVAAALDGVISTLKPGEALIYGKGGGYVRVCADGSILVDGPLNVNGDVNVDGNLITTGDIADRSALHGDLNDFRTAYLEHEHPVNNVQTGSANINTGTTSKPTT